MRDMLGLIVATLAGLLGLAAVALAIWEGDHVYMVWVASSYESQLANKIDKTYRLVGAMNASNLSNSAAINGGMVPEGLLTGDGSTLKGPWSGSTVTVSGLASGGFQSAWTGVSAHDCASFAGGQHSNGGVTINGTTITFGNGGDTVTQIASACNASSASTATITFLYPA
ncbi:type 4 pilus major pilin [Acetobacter okinawensis]|uniref:type 4 pilus major pilin n=1 Tax=Acetobacter okinawensis TaxID=1076594 RepID=UPI00046FA170|nr:type 4 pilus major pilin [Acetobacter okinawensis]